MAESLHLVNRPMDSVQVGKTVLVSKSYTTMDLLLPVDSISWVKKNHQEKEESNACE